ncbi:MAG: CaiB/BaiF CoA transferase family protein [Dehalococcoidia bacterium]
MLTPYRVLDLTDSRAELGSMILADLGADVIKVEPPSGSGSRRDPPLASSLGNGLSSLRFAAFNRNKRSVCLDLDLQEGREQFFRLVKSADFIFENDRPGGMAARGLGFDALAQVNPQLVYVAITPFGQDGPYAPFLATDLTLAAMGGMIAVNGDADRRPIRISLPQTWLHAAAEGAIAALVAHQRRQRSGEAQFVDVSVQASVFWANLNAMIASAIQGKDIERNGTVLPLGTFNLRVMFPCVDGTILLTTSGGTLPAMVPWMTEEGIVPAAWITDENWLTYMPRLLMNESVVYPLELVLDRVQAYTQRHSKQQLMQLGLSKGLFFAPVNSMADVLAFDHLTVRDYWRPLTLTDGHRVRAPGPFVRFNRKPIQWRYGVPSAGEHSSALLNETAEMTRKQTRPNGAARERGWSSQPDGLGEAGQAGSATENAGMLPFAGLKVADFSWVGVGPITARYLADHGATTVHVESATRPDILRTAGPFKDGIFGVNRSQYFGGFNTSKLSIALDLKQPAAKDVARRLIAWADVCLESFTPGTMAELGLGYEVARSLNPQIIMVSSCLMGQSGPAAPLAGYGFHAAAVSGYPEVTGWPDRPPSGPFSAYSDTIANRFLAASIMAAIDHRGRTGEGQYIEQAQLESTLYYLSPELLDFQVSGRLPRRMGNASPDAAPHDVYQCLGEDEWCAIAVETDQQWLSLRRALGEPDWAGDPALDCVSGRLVARELIDAHLGEWTRLLTPHDVMQQLQAAGVPAGAVQRSSDLLQDPQLQHRHFFRPHPHPEMGVVPYEGHQFRIRGYDSGPRFAAPCLGEHSLQVMQDLLGMTDEEIAVVVTSGALV